MFMLFPRDKLSTKHWLFWWLTITELTVLSVISDVNYKYLSNFGEFWLETDEKLCYYE